MTARRVAVGATAFLLASGLAGCSLDGGPIPVDVPGGIGDTPDAPAGASTECERAYPGLAGSGSLADAAGIVPAEWPDPPLGAELCVVIVPNDHGAVLQYVSPRQDVEAVLDHYEVALQELRHDGWEFVRGVGIAEQPILNVTGPDLEFAIQTDAGTATYVVGFEVLAG